MQEIKSRLQFLDLMRGWVILIMIEVHVFNDMLLNTVKSQSWFQIVNFINGMVAPTFLFVSGFVFILNTVKKKEQYFQFKSELWKQLGRIFMVWVIGYALHLPFNSFWSMTHTSLNWQMFFQCDILHCISFGWLILLIFRFIFRTEVFYKVFLLIAGIGFVFFSFFFWKTEFSPNFFTAYLNGQISFFPIFPWLGFLFLGGFLAVLYLESKERQKDRLFVKSVCWAGFFMVICASLLSFISLSIDWRANPFFFFIRLGIIFIFLSLTWFYEQRKSIRSFFLLTAGKESLFIYVGHLLILYTTLFQAKKLSDIFHDRLNLLEAILATLILLLTMIFSAKLWQMIKQKPTLKKTVISIFLAGLLLVFFLH